MLSSVLPLSAQYIQLLPLSPRMFRTVLGIHDQAGPVLIRASEGADKPTSQDMAVLGSIVTYAEGLGVQFGTVATESFRIGFNRY